MRPIQYLQAFLFEPVGPLDLFPPLLHLSPPFAAAGTLDRPSLAVCNFTLGPLHTYFRVHPTVVSVLPSWVFVTFLASWSLSINNPGAPHTSRHHDFRHKVRPPPRRGIAACCQREGDHDDDITIIQDAKQNDCCTPSSAHRLGVRLDDPQSRLGHWSPGTTLHERSSGTGPGGRGRGQGRRQSGSHSQAPPRLLPRPLPGWRLCLGQGSHCCLPGGRRRAGFCSRSAREASG